MTDSRNEAAELRAENQQLLDANETLSLEVADLRSRLDEHRCFIGRHALEIVSVPHRIDPERDRMAIRMQERAGIISAEQAAEQIAATYEPPYISRQTRAVIRETSDIPSYHELLMLGDKDYKAAFTFLCGIGLDSQARDQMGRDTMVSVAQSLEKGGMR